MEFVPASRDDFDELFSIYAEAMKFQKTVFGKSWLGFDRVGVLAELAEGRLWKILVDGDTACIFSITYSDPVLWGEDSDRSAMYLHRIATHPDFHGRGHVRSITEWAINHARSKGLRFIRMDTWADNQKLIDYYQDCGFRFVGLKSPPESPTLPAHYRGISLSLFEIDLNAVDAQARP